MGVKAEELVPAWDSDTLLNHEPFREILDLLNCQNAESYNTRRAGRKPKDDIYKELRRTVRSDRDTVCTTNYELFQALFVTNRHVDQELCSMD